MLSLKFIWQWLKSIFHFWRIILLHIESFVDNLSLSALWISYVTAFWPPWLLKKRAIRFWRFFVWHKSFLSYCSPDALFSLVFVSLIMPCLYLVWICLSLSQLYFFRAVLGSEKNWKGVTEISQMPHPHKCIASNSSEWYLYYKRWIYVDMS